VSVTTKDRVYEVKGTVEIVSCDRCSAVAPSRPPRLNYSKAPHADADIAGWGHVYLTQKVAADGYPTGHERCFVICPKCCEVAAQFIGKAALERKP
jgi:hypothetical protein